MRLKAIIHDAKMICRHKLLLVQQQQSEEGNEELDTLIDEASNVFQRFDRVDAWSSPIEFDELLLRQQILSINKAEETDLPAFAETMNALLESLKGLVPEQPRARSLFDINSLNPQMEEALLKNQRLIDDIVEKFREAGENLGQLPEYQEVSEHQQNLISNYLEKLRNNDLQANSVDLEIINVNWGGIFEAMNENLPPSGKFIEYSAGYNEEVEGICPLAA